MILALPPMTDIQEVKIVLNNLETCIKDEFEIECKNKYKRQYAFDITNPANKALIFLVQARIFYNLVTNDFHTIADENFMLQFERNLEAYFKYLK